MRNDWRVDSTPRLPAEGTSLRTYPFGSLTVEESEVVMTGLVGSRRIAIADVVFVRANAGRLRIETAARVHHARLGDAATAARLSRMIRARVVAASGGGGRFDGGV
jgi:hypothetical protein